jgi:hypothetical protein
MQGWAGLGLLLPRCASDDEDDGNGERVSSGVDAAGESPSCPSAAARRRGSPADGIGVPPLPSQQTGELRGAPAAVALDASAAVDQPPSSPAAIASLAANSGAHAGVVARMLRAPQSFIGCTVRREFHGVLYTGTVTDTFCSTGHQLWHVVYDDGDQEDYNKHQMHAFMQLEDGSTLAAPLGHPQQAQAQQFKGVRFDQFSGLYRMEVNCGRGPHITNETLPSAMAAACAYDEVIRSRGFVVMNFPRPGSGELQAVRGETMVRTLARALQGGDARTRAAAVQPTESAAVSAHAAAAAGPMPPPPPSTAPQARRKRARADGAAAAADHAAAAVALPAAAGGAPAARSSAERVTDHAAAAPAQRASGGAADDVSHADEVARVQALLHSITPPLSQLDAALAAVPGSGLTLALLASGGSLETEAQQAWLKEVTEKLHIATLRDTLAFMRALVDASNAGRLGGANT